ncbi:hypothetical protein KP509_37G049700 [Ceratopteris richardii]|nr:hypothetical protein KP509_37G049700 [Ceratopteris richardii]
MPGYCPRPVFHTNSLSEADSRCPASKKNRSVCDSCSIGKQCNANCHLNPTAKQLLPLKRVDVSLELYAFDQLSVHTLIPSDGGVEILRHLVDSVSPLHSKSSPGPFLYHVKDYNNVIRILKDIPGVVLQNLPQSTLSMVQRMHKYNYSPQNWIPFMPHHISDAAADELMQKLPCKLKETLLPFQLEGIKYGLRRGGRVLIADEMGVGKTIQAISLAACYAKEGSILIVCPASLRLMWAEELERWLPFLLPADVHLVFGRKTRIPDGAKTPKVVVISYTMLCRLKKQMMMHKWALLIVDESHTLRCTRNKLECQETTSILDIGQAIKRIILLSGTPSLSRPFDIFHQVNLISPGLLGRNKYDFARSYCSSQLMEGNQAMWLKDFSKGKRLNELNILLKETIMVRRLKEQVLAQLPPKRRQVIRLKIETCDLLEVQEFKELYQKENKEIPCPCGFSFKGNCDCEETDEDWQRQCDQSEEGNSSRSALSYQEIGVAKLRAIREWLSNHPVLSDDNDVISSGTEQQVQKMIIFGHHLKVLDSIQEIVHSKGLEYVRIDGSTSTHDRHKAVDAFRNVGKVRVAIIGLTAGGVGLDFSSAQTVVFAELPKSSSELLQAEDRAHRHGQKNAVNIYYFCAKDTSDEMQWQSLSRSIERVSTMTNGSGDAIAEIKVDEVLGCLNGNNSQEREQHIIERETNENSIDDKKECLNHKSCNPADSKAQLHIHCEKNIKHFDDVQCPTSLMFEVSVNTGRVHIYARSDLDGLRPVPLQESFRPEDLEQLNESSDTRQSTNVPSFLKESADHLKCACSFVQQWNSLRPFDQRCLLGRPLQLPLAFELECSKADNGLVKGGSKRRVRPKDEIASNLPEDASLKMITLHHNAFKDRNIQQPWSSAGEPLCKLCYHPCLAINARNPEYYEDLFCTKECYQKFRITTSQTYIRQELFALEKGVCTMCKLDCHSLVERIRPLPYQQRRQYVLKQAPDLENNPRLLERLLSDPKEGNAWHADHIVAVYQGGGECTLQNMRTLCVTCHAKVTAEQNKKRRKSLSRAKDNFHARIEKHIEKWCEQRMQEISPQDNIGKQYFGDESSEDDIDSDILDLEITGSKYSRLQEKA